MVRGFSIILLLGLWLPSAATLAADRVLVMGDSLSAGYGLRPGEVWVSLLEQRLQQDYPEATVINASISGETTAGALARMPRALEVHHPTVVVIELGGNDGLRGFPLPVVRANLEQLIALSRAAGADVLLLGMRLPANYGPQYTERFHQLYLDLAEAQKVPLVDFFLEDFALDDGLMQDDGIHPTAEAQPLMLDEVWPKLAALLGSSANL